MSATHAPAPPSALPRPAVRFRRVVATLAGVAWWVLRPRRLRRRIALGCGYGAMLLMLLLGNLLSSYVYQFAILVEVALQVITLGLLLRWDQATRPAPAG